MHAIMFTSSDTVAAMIMSASDAPANSKTLGRDA